MSGFSLTKEIVNAQNADTSSTIIGMLNANDHFLKLSKFEGDLIHTRDVEDDTKLAAGIKIGVDRGSLDANHVAEPYKTIDVMGKTPQDVCDIILADVGESAQSGALLVFCGLSGTGKGTTVTLLSGSLPNCVTWSNGNIFRSITLLAVAWCEQNGMSEFDASRALSDDNIRSFLSMLSFEKVDGQWQVVINGLGINTTVSKIQNTDLKSPRVSKNIPTVAQQTQGEVIAFARTALEKMRADGHNILLEGREQTVNYMPTPYRYTLTISDSTLLGKRRAAQRLGAAVQTEANKQPSGGEEADLALLLEEQLVAMVAEANL
mmetsp:Transcript_5069/g.10141  ORF Transcript_5069/g.10141 Transcript_5069/m.10141 type:complete len:320 (+) Transcript_5069:81-1040(+)|eukprot:CAMPEP_0181295324 /NCGR_PEP_ID=MMETSP1101-20121128/4086_1 /TAXON_ID=46948 /ORGANISM="Rhodomonas abbreviata, Strain Caron Lab Isolate" /LENGTH=319 /DNA_ID=CAMNT_0023400067 /DNA_START=79 /DNA_END=1038 /DNA_ORIENTATION=+